MNLACMMMVGLLMTGHDIPPIKHDEAPKPSPKKTEAPLEASGKGVVELKDLKGGVTTIVVSQAFFKELAKKSKEHSWVPRAQAMTAGIAFSSLIIFVGLY